MRTSQVRRFVLSFSLLALVFAPCLSIAAPVASADPTFLPMFDDEIVASATVGSELRIVPAMHAFALELGLNVTVTYDRLDVTIASMGPATSVRTDGGFISGANSLALLGLCGLTGETDLVSDVGLGDARRHD